MLIERNLIPGPWCNKTSKKSLRAINESSILTNPSTSLSAAGKSVYLLENTKKKGRHVSLGTPAATGKSRAESGLTLKPDSQEK